MSTDSPSSLMPVDPPFAVYRDQLTALSHGLALWNPSPPKKIYNNVSIGDVGYLHEGKFIRVFNVTLPWDHPSNGLLGKLEPYDLLDCGQFTYTIEDDFDKVDHYSRFVTAKTNAGNSQAKTPDDMEGVTYKCRSRGALLSLPNGGRREDVIRTKVFEEYIRDHVDNWFNWAQNNKLGVERMEDLILVSGCTLVTSWAAAAFVDNTCDAEVSLASRSLSNVGASFVWGNVQGRVSYHNSRFNSQNLPTMADQCVFIRGFRAKRILFWTRRIRAAAEPRPDDPDNRREDEIQVSRIAGAPKYRDPLVGVLDYIAEKCQMDNVEEGVLAITHHDDLQFLKDVETLTADTIEEFLHRKQMPLFVENGVAILHGSADNEPPVFLHNTSLLDRNSPAMLRAPPETNQMTAERKGGRFRWERGSHLFRFRRMTWARFASLLGIRNSPTVPTPISSSNGPYLASSVASSQPEPPHPAKTAQTNLQASKSSLDEWRQNSSVVSSQPIPIPVQRSRSRNGGPSGSIAARSVSNTPFPSSSPRTVHRDSIMQHASPLPPASLSAPSVSSISSLSEPSSSYDSSYAKNSEMDRRYEEHRAAVQRREEEVKRKEAAARRSAEEARRREEAAARHEEDAKRKYEEATRRMREAELREQQVRAWEARTRKEMELAQKEVEVVRARKVSQSANPGGRDDGSKQGSQDTNLKARRAPVALQA